MSAERTSFKNDKVSRPIELVRHLRAKTEKPNRRFRIDLADDLFAGRNRRGGSSPRARKSPEALVTSESDGEQCLKFEVSRVQLVVGLAAIAGMTLGYLLGRRNK